MKRMKPIDCEQALLRIFDLLDCELKAGDRKAMQRHLDACRSCFSRVEFERRLKQKLRTLREADNTDASRRRVEKLLKAL